MNNSSLLGNIHSMPGEMALGFADPTIWDESIEQVLDFTENYYSKGIYPKTISQSLSFTQTLDASYNYNQSLAFTDSFENQLSPELTISQTLEFEDSFTCTGTFNHDISQVLLFVDSYSNLKKKKQVTLKSRFGNIVLPAPLFGDGDSQTDLLLYKRSIDGVIYTYVNRTDMSRLTYTFQLTKNQAISFYNWLKVNDAEQITIENWKGERWLTKIMSQSYDFTSVQRAKNSYELLTIPIEFEGTRLL